jgi:hypothetical protein
VDVLVCVVVGLVEDRVLMRKNGKRMRKATDIPSRMKSSKSSVEDCVCCCCCGAPFAAVDLPMIPSGCRIK